MKHRTKVYILYMHLEYTDHLLTNRRTRVGYIIPRTCARRGMDIASVYRAKGFLTRATARCFSACSENISAMKALFQLTVLACALSFASCAHDLSEDYLFKTTLNTEEDGGLYELHWTFDDEAKTISFAVRVQTTGWVGFGISPNGQMPNSDVVIGWVTEDGKTIFHVSLVAEDL